MPNDFLTDDEVGLSSVLSDSDVGLGPIPSVALNPYQQLQMQGQGLGLSATTGPVNNPEEVLAWARAVDLPRRAISKVAETGMGVASDLVLDFLNRTGIDPSAQPGQPIIPQEVLEKYATSIPGTNIRPLEFISPQIEEGVRSGLAEAGSQFTEPGQIGLLPFAGLKPVQALFGLQSAIQVPESVRQFAEAPDLRTASKAATRGLVNLGIAGSIGSHLLKPKVTGATYTSPEGENTVAGNHVDAAAEQGVDASGPRESRETPQFGFEVTARNGESQVVTRPQAERIAKESGQLIKPPQTGQLHSDEVASPMEPNKPLGDTGGDLVPSSVSDRTINRQIGNWPKGTKVELTGVKGEDPINPWTEVKMPDGSLQHLPGEWITGGLKFTEKTLPRLLSKVGRQRLQELIGEWDDNAELSEDGKSIIGYTDPRNMTGRQRIPTKDFFAWLNSEEGPKSLTEQPTTPPQEPASPIDRAKEKEVIAQKAIEKDPDKVTADRKRYDEVQAEFLASAKQGKWPSKELMQENEDIKNRYGGHVPPTYEDISEFRTDEPTPTGILEKVSSRLDDAADAARSRLQAQRGSTTFGSGPLHELSNIRDYAIIGAAKIAKGATEFARWSGEMVKEFGEAIKPHLENIFRRAQEAFDEHSNVVTRVNRILYEAGLPRRSVAEAGKKALGKSIESGVEAGRALSEAESAPKLADVQKQLSESIPNAVALREYFKGQEKGGKAGRKAVTEELKLADKWLEADSKRIRDSLISLANSSLPVSERGRFLKAITDATKRPPLVGGDPEIMYRKAAQVAARIEDRATEVRKANLATEIKDAVAKSISSPSVDIGYKNKILDAVKRIAFKKPTAETLDALKATRDFLSRQEAAGADVTIPKEVLDDLEALGKVPARELPEHVLEAVRDKVNLLDQLGRLKVKARQQAWDIEKNSKIKELSTEPTNPLQERPQFRQQPGDPRPLSMKIRNWANRQLNMAALIDKALLPIDALFDLLGDAKGTYKGWLFKNIRNPLDLNFNEYSVLRDSKTAPLENIIKEHNLGEREAERIGVYATALQEGGIDRMVQMGVKPETISNILANITPAEMKAYQAMRRSMDSTLPDIQKLMHELYNIEVKPVPDYFPMPRDWSLYEGEPVAKEPMFGKPMDFDELAGWKQMLGDFTQPKTSRTERGFTIERKPEAGTPIKLNAFDVFYQHMNDVAYLLKTQRNLKMMGEMARGDLFKQKYGNVGQNIVTGWLDTVARQGRLGGLRRIPFLDELRRRTSVGVIGFRLASQFVHLSNIPLSVWRTGGPLWWKAGLGESLTEKGQQFLKDNFNETFSRGGGEPALVEASQSGVSAFGKTVVPKSIVKASFAIARKIDQMNAQATTLGTYLRLLSEKGIDPRDYDKIPIDKEAQAQSLVLARRAVASPLSKDVSPSLSRGAITGGNVSLARTIFQFQNIFQDQWSNIRHDLLRAGIKEKNPKLAATAFVALTAMILSEMGIRESSKELISSLTGSKPKKEPSDQEKIALELARRVPFGGQLTSQIMYGQSGIPSIDSITQVSKAAKTAATAKKEATQTKALIRAVSGAAQLGGVPGASQIGELIEKSQ